jgi:hypothetical protein
LADVSEVVTASIIRPMSDDDNYDFIEFKLAKLEGYIIKPLKHF